MNSPAKTSTTPSTKTAPRPASSQTGQQLPARRGRGFARRVRAGSAAICSSRSSIWMRRRNWATRLPAPVDGGRTDRGPPGRRSAASICARERLQPARRPSRQPVATRASRCRRLSQGRGRRTATSPALAARAGQARPPPSPSSPNCRCSAGKAHVDSAISFSRRSTWPCKVFIHGPCSCRASMRAAWRRSDSLDCQSGASRAQGGSLAARVARAAAACFCNRPLIASSVRRRRGHGRLRPQVRPVRRPVPSARSQRWRRAMARSTTRD